jgi:hypothetical protein
VRTPSNIYVLNEIGKEKCFLGKEDKVSLWHKIMGHINFDNVFKVRKKGSQRNSPYHESNQHIVQALSTRKANQDQVQFKGILHNKTAGNCPY